MESGAGSAAASRKRRPAEKVRTRSSAADEWSTTQSARIQTSVRVDRWSTSVRVIGALSAAAFSTAEFDGIGNRQPAISIGIPLFGGSFQHIVKFTSTK